MPKAVVLPLKDNTIMRKGEKLKPLVEMTEVLMPKVVGQLLKVMVLTQKV